LSEKSVSLFNIETVKKFVLFKHSSDQDLTRIRPEVSKTVFSMGISCALAMQQLGIVPKPLRSLCLTGAPPLRNDRQRWSNPYRALDVGNKKACLLSKASF